MFEDDLFDHAVNKLRSMRATPVIPCKICGGEARPFDIVDFNKSCDKSLYPLQVCGVPVVYRLCDYCRFIFTDFGDDFTNTQWQQHVYNEDYIKVDPEYLDVRPRRNAFEIISLLSGKKQEIIGLDYGGGNGATAKLLRGNGWAFDCYDPFGYTDLTAERIGHYNFCSAIEVFEHVSDPVQSLQSIVGMTSSARLIVLMGTNAHDRFVSRQNRLSWWYAAPRNGHISLYSRKTLSILGAKCGLTYACIGETPHLLTRGIEKSEVRSLLLRGKVLRRLRSAFNVELSMKRT